MRVKRAYERAEPSDGMRILIDRLWPRGVTKKALEIEVWVKKLAPSKELRRWYRHEPERYPEFRRRYLAQLESARDRLAELRAPMRGRTVTLVTATRDLALSHAEILREVLKRKS